MASNTENVSLWWRHHAFLNVDVYTDNIQAECWMVPRIYRYAQNSIMWFNAWILPASYPDNCIKNRFYPQSGTVVISTDRMCNNDGTLFGIMKLCVIFQLLCRRTLPRFTKAIFDILKPHVDGLVQDCIIISCTNKPWDLSSESHWLFSFDLKYSV